MTISIDSIDLFEINYLSFKIFINEYYKIIYCLHITDQIDFNNNNIFVVSFSIL
jgi:hypothetical protein